MHFSALHHPTRTVYTLRIAHAYRKPIGAHKWHARFPSSGTDTGNGNTLAEVQRLAQVAAANNGPAQPQISAQMYQMMQMAGVLNPMASMMGGSGMMPMGQMATMNPFGMTAQMPPNMHPAL